MNEPPTQRKTSLPLPHDNLETPQPLKNSTWHSLQEQTTPHRATLTTTCPPQSPPHTDPYANRAISDHPRARPSSQGPPQPLREPWLPPLPSTTALGKKSLPPRTPLTPQSRISSAVCGSGPAFSSSPVGPSLPGSVAPGCPDLPPPCPDSSQGHWPGRSGGAEGPLGTEAGWEGWGKGGAGRGLSEGHFICRKHLGKCEGWISCGPALERGNCCFPAPLLSPLPSCPHPPASHQTHNSCLPCLPQPSHHKPQLPLLPAPSLSSLCGWLLGQEPASSSAWFRGGGMKAGGQEEAAPFLTTSPSSPDLCTHPAKLPTQLGLQGSPCNLPAPPRPPPIHCPPCSATTKSFRGKCPFLLIATNRSLVSRPRWAQHCPRRYQSPCLVLSWFHKVPGT